MKLTLRILFCFVLFFFVVQVPCSYAGVGSRVTKAVVKSVKGESDEVAEKVTKNSARSAKRTAGNVAANEMRRMTQKMALETSSKLPKETLTQCKNALEEIWAKKPIILTNDEMKKLVGKMDAARNDFMKREIMDDFIFAKIGKTYKSGYREFFIRLKMGDENQVKRLLTNKGIRESLRDIIYRTRDNKAGLAHEWIPRGLVDDLLKNKSKNADFAFYAQDVLKQSTSNVITKDGYLHMGNKMMDDLTVEARKEFSRANDLFHKNLDRVIRENMEKSPEAQIEAIRDFAEGTLSPASYEDFLSNVIKPFLGV